MPYFIYKITPPRKLEHLDTKDSFQEARTRIRKLRQDTEDEPDTQVRMIFARNTAEAEKLLSRPPDDRVIGED